MRLSRQLLDDFAHPAQPFIEPASLRDVPFWKKPFHKDFTGWKYWNTYTVRGKAAIGIGAHLMVLGSAWYVMRNNKKVANLALEKRRADRAARHAQEELAVGYKMWKQMPY